MMLQTTTAYSQQSSIAHPTILSIPWHPLEQEGTELIKEHCLIPAIESYNSEQR